MVQAVASTRVEPKAVVRGPNTYQISGYFSQPAEASTGPQGFLVECPTPHGVIRPHFHRVNQFQVVIAGGGRLGKHAIGPIAVHYTDGFTPYGPIVAEADGVTFYTLRVRPDTGAHYMPGSRDKMERRAGRGLSAEITPEKGTVIETTVDATRRRHLAPQADGLAAETIEIRPNGHAIGPDPRGGGGQYYVVTAGSLRQNDEDLPPRSLIFAAPDDVAPELTAGPAGASVLIVQFPQESADEDEAKGRTAAVAT